jgi:uncharacterized protein YndB with AHSA1/START domain
MTTFVARDFKRVQGVMMPLELQVAVTFKENLGKTKMTMQHIGVPPGKMSDMCRAGWNESFDKLAEALKKE